MTRAPFDAIRRKRRAGAVLLIVLGILAIMSVMTLSFMKMAQLERNISNNYVNRTRAILAAESGVEYAIARLRGFSGGVLSPDEILSIQFNPDDPNLPLSDPDCVPSFATDVDFDGTIDAWSGSVGGTYFETGDRFKLKVQSESGKLNLNDSNELMNEGVAGTERMTTILAALGDILFGGGKGIAIADALFYKRDVELDGQFSSMEQVREALMEDDPFGGGPVLVDLDDYRAFERNVTIYGWRDPDVIKPCPVFKTYQDAVDLYGATGAAMLNFGFPFMRWQEMQSYNDHNSGAASPDHNLGYSLSPRSPVNINQASRELIQALMTGLEGWSLFEGPQEKNQCVSRDSLHSSPSWRYTSYSPSNLGFRHTRTVGSGTSYNYFNDTNFDYHCWPRIGSGTWGWSFRDMSGKLILDDPVDLGITTLPTFTIAGLPYARVRRIQIPDTVAAWLAADLYDRIHGEGVYTSPLTGEKPNPMESWREFEFYLNNVIGRAKTQKIEALKINDPIHGLSVNTPFSGMVKSDSDTVWSYDRTNDFQYFNEYCRDLILANFDPNTLSNDFNPDKVVFRNTDKADLIYYSTEFSFEDLCGVYTIESLGRVLSDKVTSISEYTITAQVDLFEAVRLTTQSQLVGSVTSAPVMRERFGKNKSASMTKWGDIVGGNTGSMTMSHPEPYVASLSDPMKFIKEGVFDGRIGLSPVKHNVNRPPVVEGVSATLWTWFEGTFSAQDLNGTVKAGAPSDSSEVLRFQSLPYGRPMAYEELRESDSPLLRPHSHAFTGGPGTVFADGVFSEASKCPGWIPDNHLVGSPAGFRQSVMFAMKPNFNVKDSNRTRNFLQMGQGSASDGIAETYNTLFTISRMKHANFNHYPGQMSSHSAAYTATDWYAGAGTATVVEDHPVIAAFGFSTPATYSRTDRNNFAGVRTRRTNFIGQMDKEDPDRDYIRTGGQKSYHFEGRRWNLFTASWKLASGNCDIALRVNNCASDPGMRKTTGNPQYGLDNPYRDYNYDASKPFKAPIRLGAFVRKQEEFMNPHEPSDSTFGEFQLFASDFNLNNATPPIWDEGFFYSDTADPAAYVTPEIDLGANENHRVTVRSVSWTCRWPEYLKSSDQSYNQTRVDPVWNDYEFTAPAWMGGDLPNQWTPFSVDIQENVDTDIKPDWLYGRDTTEGGYGLKAPQTGMTYCGGSVPNLPGGGSLQTRGTIKLKFYFNTPSILDRVEPMRESPYLDDITITYYSSAKVKFLYYIGK